MDLNIFFFKNNKLDIKPFDLIRIIQYSELGFSRKIKLMEK